MSPDDQPIPISALQHWLYCPRQCALIHLEQAWSENKFTAEGRVVHENAHDGSDETRGTVRITRGMPVMSASLGLSGQCDVVEFHSACGDFKSRISNFKSDPLKSEILDLKCTQIVRPVEYKRGKPKAHRADEVQLCAQAICLEEMLHCSISSGSLYYGQNRRRTEVAFDAELRQLVLSTLQAIKDCFSSRITPQAEYNPRRCDNCSLIDHCQPKALRFKKGAAAWFSSHLKSEI
jgi:CRISPR-associated exonuclease Cas4